MNSGLLGSMGEWAIYPTMKGSISLGNAKRCGMMVVKRTIGMFFDLNNGARTKSQNDEYAKEQVRALPIEYSQKACTMARTHSDKWDI